MKIKPLYWNKVDPDRLTAVCMGLVLAAYKNNGKWEARLANPYQRVEIQQGFGTAKEAMRYAEHILLPRELRKYFSYVDEKEKKDKKKGGK